MPFKQEKTVFNFVSKFSLLLIVLISFNACKKTPVVVDGVCEEMTLSVTQGSPLQRVSIQNLPAVYKDEFSTFEVWVEGENTGVFATVESESGQYDFAIPIHPTRPLEGGSVNLVLSNETESCSPISFNIAGLPKAPANTTKNTLQNLQNVINLLRSNANLNKTALSEANMEDLEPYEQSLKILQEYMDEPTNPYSLEKIMAGETDLIAAADLEKSFEITDAVLMHTGFQAAMQDALTKIETISGGKKSASSELCFSRPSKIQNAEELSCTMTLANDRLLSLDDDAPLNASLNEMGGILNKMGLIPYAPISGGALVGSILVLGAQTMVQAVHNCLPSSFEDLEYTVEKRSWLEDEEELGKWEKVKVIAKSKGWNMDKTVVDVLLTFLNIRGAVGSPLFADVRSKFLSQSSREGLILFAYGEFMNEIFGKYGGGSSGIFQIKADQTDWIDISDPDFHSALAEGESFQLDIFNQTIKPKKAGTSVLTVRPIASKFGGQTIEKGKANLEVIPIEVSTDRMLITVQEPGETITLNGFIENAMDYSLEWTTTAGELIFLEFEDTELGHEVYDLETPVNVEDYPIVVTIESTSSTGARNPAYNPFPRRTSINISLTTLELSVNGDTCLKPGENTSIEAVVVGADNGEVLWTVEPNASLITSVVGEINMANFTAPEEEGSYKITATSIENPALEKSVRIRVRKSCDNYIRLTVNGETTESALSSLSISPQLEICSENNTGETNCSFMAVTNLPWIEGTEFGAIPIDLYWEKSGFGNVSPIGTHSLSINSENEIIGGVIKIWSIPIVDGGMVEYIQSTSATLIVHQFDKKEKILVAEFSGDFEGYDVHCIINIEGK